MYSGQAITVNKLMMIHANLIILPNEYAVMRTRKLSKNGCSRGEFPT